MTGWTRTLNLDGTWARKGLSHVSVKRRQVCFADSKLECDAFLRAEFDDDVVIYKPQPISFSLVVKGRKVRYTPDILFQYMSVSYRLMEVKPDEKAAQESFMEGFEYRRWYAKKKWGIDLKLLRESEIRIGSSIDNYERLYYYRVFSNPEPVSRHKLLRRFGRHCSFRDFKEGMHGWSTGSALPFMSLAWKQYVFDDTLKLADDTDLEFR